AAVDAGGIEVNSRSSDCPKASPAVAFVKLGRRARGVGRYAPSSVRVLIRWSDAVATLRLPHVLGCGFGRRGLVGPFGFCTPGLAQLPLYVVHSSIGTAGDSRQRRYDGPASRD